MNSYSEAKISSYYIQNANISSNNSDFINSQANLSSQLSIGSSNNNAKACSKTLSGNECSLNDELVIFLLKLITQDIKYSPNEIPSEIFCYESIF